MNPLTKLVKIYLVKIRNLWYQKKKNFLEETSEHYIPVFTLGLRTEVVHNYT